MDRTLTRPLVDSSEQVYISSLALLKMLKHGVCWSSLLSGMSALFCFESDGYGRMFKLAICSFVGDLGLNIQLPEIPSPFN